MSEKLERNNFNNDEWGFEAEQNWFGFWNLILQEDMRQNPEYYKKIKEENNENNRSSNNPNKT